jgi:hypothetical protein
VLITRNGKPVAVLLGVQNEAEAEELAVDRSRSLRSIFKVAHEQIRKGGGIPHDQFWPGGRAIATHQSGPLHLAGREGK